MSTLRVPFFVAGAIALILFIGYIDIITGFVPDVTILYLIPVVGITYRVGLQYGVLMAVIAGATEGFSTISLGVGRSAILVLDTTMHFLVFTFGAIITDRLVVQLTTITQLEQRRTQDLSIARDVHASVFSPVPAQYGPLNIAVKVAFAHELGGDYYHFGQRRDKLFACVADISGKSVAAALFSALLHQNIVSALKSRAGLNEMVAAINASMYAMLPDNMFITLFCAFIDETSIVYINAGHEPPLLYSRKYGDIRLLQSQAPMPIGIDSDLHIEQDQAALESGDLLLMVTDGVTESAAFRDAPFDTLKSVLLDRRDDDSQHIVNTVFAMANPGEQAEPEDDIIAICIKKQA